MIKCNPKVRILIAFQVGFQITSSDTKTQLFPLHCSPDFLVVSSGKSQLEGGMI